jgi:hypothetical protein
VIIKIFYVIVCVFYVMIGSFNVKALLYVFLRKNHSSLEAEQIGIIITILSSVVETDIL